MTSVYHHSDRWCFYLVWHQCITTLIVGVFTWYDISVSPLWLLVFLPGMTSVYHHSDRWCFYLVWHQCITTLIVGVFKICHQHLWPCGCSSIQYTGCNFLVFHQHSQWNSPTWQGDFEQIHCVSTVYIGLNFILKMHEVWNMKWDC
jgi:hypothetical protein